MLLGNRYEVDFLELSMENVDLFKPKAGKSLGHETSLYLWSCIDRHTDLYKQKI